MSMLAIARIRTDGGTQTRACIRPEVVEEYAALNGEMPPVIVFYDENGVYWLADGFHRLEGRKKQGKSDIECDIREGSLRQAVLYSFTANHKHGLRLSSEDKRYAVAKALNDAEWSKMSDRWIADLAGCSHTLVSEMRSQLAESASSKENSPSKPKKRKGKDGVVRKVKPKKPKAEKPVYLCARCSRVGTASCDKCRKKVNPVIDPRHTAPEQPAKPPEPEEGREPGVEKEEDTKPVTDAEGHEVPGSIADAFLADFDRAVSLCQELQKLIDALACGPGGAQLARFVSPKRSGEKVIQRSKHLDALKQDLKGTRPHSVCPFCKGKQKPECKGCNGEGWVSKTTWDGCEDAVKGRLAS
jgi:uncharacterized ParB-like nuclease family protein